MPDSHDTITVTSTTSIPGTDTVEKVVSVDLSAETLNDATTRIVNNDPSFIANQVVKTKDEGAGYGTVTYRARE
ncbi:hypothetical protein I350_00022 [Cryptococcus amylolentus CBS 6273]|uniref:Uncharacterized protein n=1 Tax=Cryptococcus amylolentus CBS 6273 TaxID=1296118 RepID=A0A1E3KF78_9TREE|nr:hypothetical protein I350_00022 [Cryptococcus amylolentus CBS 6273]